MGGITKLGGGMIEEQSDSDSDSDSQENQIARQYTTRQDHNMRLSYDTNFIKSIQEKK